MEYLVKFLVIVQILSAIGMVGFILLQRGKGADMGASFGSGASGSLFGAAGTANFLSRTTAVLATMFFLSTLAQAFLSGSVSSRGERSVLESVTIPSETSTTPVQSPSIPAGK